jgi:hypothetical protein
MPGSWIKGWSLPQAVLTAVVCLQSVERWPLSR